jgi:hypothetical protein
MQDTFTEKRLAKKCQSTSPETFATIRWTGLAPWECRKAVLAVYSI